MNSAPVVSVVTPVYNGAEHLAEAVQSVLRQSCPDWEYVIYDNVSTDNTGLIVDRFAAQDSRIRVVHATEFVHATTNHNRAVRAIDPRSRYLKILHSDDWLYPECLERMVAVAESHPSVGVVSSFRLVNDHVEHQSPMPYSESAMPGQEVVHWELFGHKDAWVTGADSSLLYRADFVRQAPNFYDQTVWHCDTDTAYRVLMCSDFGFVHQVMTFTRRQTQGLNPFSQRVWSFITRDGRLLMRYGPRLLNARTYRAKLRAWLARYGIWLTKQVLKPWRWRQREFQEFHHREIGYLLAEAHGDYEVQLVLAAYRRLLLHGADRPWNDAPAGPRSATI